MLQLELPDIPDAPDSEWLDESTSEFITLKGQKGCKGQTIQLEHSLISISKWESKWHKPFLSKEEKTYDETVDYIRCMTLTQNVNPRLYENMSAENIKKVMEYIDDPYTATTFNSRTPNGRKRTAQQTYSRQRVTSELIYYWMVALEIPSAYEKWHLNRLLTLIQVCNIKGQPEKKMSKKDIYKSNAALNAARRAKAGSRG